MEQQLKGGAMPRAWYREHAHPVLLPLDEEESHLLRSLVGAAKQLHHHIILIHHALGMHFLKDTLFHGFKSNSVRGRYLFLILPHHSSRGALISVAPFIYRTRAPSDHSQLITLVL